MMSAIPYMPLYVADYLADTSHLSTLEHGAYLLLIMNYWQRGKALPSNDQQLARICRLTGKQWGKVKTPIGNLFEFRDGLWFHHRIEAELAKVRDKSTKASNAGKASAQQKANARSTPVEQTFNHTDTDTDIQVTTLPVGQTRRGTRLPDDFEPDPTCRALAETLLLTIPESQQALDNFLDYWRGVPGAKGVKLDWQATFRNSLRKFAQLKPKANHNGPRTAPQHNTIAAGFEVIDAAIAAERRRIESLERELGLAGDGAGDGRENLKLVS
jgi:uncharacterized protein YdaU (DUF1376 family)